MSNHVVRLVIVMQAAAQEATGIVAMDTIPGRSPLVLMGLGWVAIASVVSYKETRGDT